MEEEEGFKYIPFRWYRGDEPYRQLLVRPLAEDGHLHTFKDLLNSLAPTSDSTAAPGNSF